MALTEIPSELSSTPSIADGGNATAITIGSDESVTLAGTLSLPNANATNEISFTGTEFTNVLSATTSGFQLGTTGAGYLAFLTNNAERMRLDSSGNFIVGGTQSNPTGANVAGASIDASGEGNFSVDGAEALRVNRLTSDGAIVQFMKAGQFVGSIAVASGNNLTIDGSVASHAGLEFGTGRITPRVAGATADNAVDLGYSTQRFQDLYLSGGAYLGGTAAVNKLEDYETGSWTPTTTGLTGVTIHTARYVKVGSLVSIDLRLAWTGSDQSNSGLVFGLPFNSNNHGNAARTGLVFYSGTSLFSGSALSSHVTAATQTVSFYASSGGNFQNVVRHQINGTYNWLLSFSYFSSE